MPITSAGVGSGIDIESIISSLMRAEEVPLRAIQSKKSKVGVQVSAYGKFKSEMSAMKDHATTMGDNLKFGKFVANSTNEEVFTATTTVGAIAEKHDINVLSLATPHRLASGLYTDSNSPVATSTYTVGSGDESFKVKITSANNTVKGMRDAINDAVGNTSVSASIINVDGGSRLVLTANKGGIDNAITGAPNFLTELTPAADASFEVDGFLASSSSNTVTDVIPGLTFELKSVGAAKLSTNRDMENLEETLNEFISSYNTVRSTISTLSDGTLRGDSLPRSFESKVRQDFFKPIVLENGDTLTAFELGFTFDKEGALSLDSDKFKTKTSQYLEGFVAAFTDKTGGFAKRMQESISGYTQAGGLIDNRTEGLDNRKSRIDDQIERFEYRLTQTEARYRRQFSAMDGTVAKLQATSSYMQTQLASFNR
jgi:flagellar hook-associated protein 2